MESSGSSGSWVDELSEEVLNTVSTQLRKWTDVIQTLGMDADRLKQYIEIYKGNVEQLVTEMTEEMDMLQEKVVNDIRKLLEKSATLCKELDLQMPEYGQENLGLYKEKAILMEKVAEFEQLKNSRLTRLNTLNSQIKELCKCLDMKRPSLTITQPIPTEEELNKLEEIFENMEMEKFQRTEKFLNIQSQIKSIINNLNLSPMPGFERDVVTMKDPSKMLTEIHLAELEAFYDRLVEKAEEVVHKISELRSKIENLWSYLDLDIQERDQLRSKFVGNSLDTLKALKDEVERCETLRKANIQTFVEKLRVQLVALWDKCNFTEDQRNRFTDFHSNLYNEDLLDLHEIELKKVTRHYEENKDLYEGLSKLKKQWKQLDELERKSADPDRFKNRGGQLLMEEKERNKLMRSIPKLEKDLVELAAEYHNNKGILFTYGGMDVAEYIRTENENREEYKKSQLTIRKQQKREALTPGKSGLSMFRSTSNLNLAAGSSCKRPRPETPGSTAKKRTKLTFPSRVNEVPSSAPPKVVLTKPTPVKTVEKKMRRLSKRFRQNIENMDVCSGSEPEYNMFEEYLKNKDSNSRSTAFNGFVAPLTPVNHDRTPQKPLMKHEAQSPKGSARKLRAVDLKFEF